MGAHWPLGCLGLGSLGRLEGLLDPAVGAPRPSWCQRMPAVLWGWRGRKHQAHGQKAPGSVTAPDGRNPVLQDSRPLGGWAALREAGLAHVFWQDPAPLSHGIELWLGPRSHEIPGPGPYHSSEPLFRARHVSDHRSQPPRWPPPPLLSSLTPRRTKRTRVKTPPVTKHAQS